MREITRTAKYKSDFKRLARSGRYDVSEIMRVLDALANGKPLDRKYQDHALSGDWANHRECHVKADWLLIYKLEPGSLILVRTGSHSDLF